MIERLVSCIVRFRFGGGLRKEEFSRYLFFYRCGRSGRQNYTSRWQINDIFSWESHTQLSEKGNRRKKAVVDSREGAGNDEISSSGFGKWLSVNSSIREWFLHNWIILFRFDLLRGEASRRVRHEAKWNEMLVPSDWLMQSPPVGACRDESILIKHSPGRHSAPSLSTNE